MKTIAITMGEPGGVGPEIALKAIELLRAEGVEFTPVLVGDAGVLDEAARAGHGLAELLKGLRVVQAADATGYKRGRPTAAGGAAAAHAIEAATRMALDGEVDAIVTAPISKEALRAAGRPWPGHTEMLAELTGASRYAMMLTGGGLRVMLATIHVAISEVPGLIDRQRVHQTIRLAAHAARMLALDSPRIAVAGLNPHASEGGIFGTEERDHIEPAIAAARAEGIDASGPYPADTVFYRAHRGEFHIVVAMYHDQGLGPLKLVGFDSGVNITVGLPIIRTSPDHGTAYEIAWQDRASALSMTQAIRAALMLRKIPPPQ